MLRILSSAPRPSVPFAMTVHASGIILFRLDPGGPRVLLLRNRSNGHWGLPKGRRDTDDGHEVLTARREVEEETGFTDLELDPDFREEVEYVVRGTEDDGRLKRVVYFLARAPDRDPVLSEEHDAFQWIGPGDVPDALAYGQLRDLARRALRHLSARHT